jgi:HlyD family secretion protein
MKKLFSKHTVEKLKAFASAHKAISALIALGLVSAVYGTLKPANTSAETHYVLGTVSRGTIESSVSGTGQVAASDQVNVAAKASGYITAVSVQTGDTVAAGDLIASIDPGDAYSSVESSQLALAKLTEAPDPATLVQAQASLKNAQNAVVTGYTNALADVTSSLIDFPSTIQGMSDLLYSTGGYLNDSTVSSLGATAESYRSAAGVEFDKAQGEYNALEVQFSNVNATSATSTKDALITSSITALGDLLTSLKGAETAVTYTKNLIDSSNQASKTSDTVGTTAEANLSTWISEMSSHYNAVTGDQTSIANAPLTLAQAQDSLNKIVNGPDPLDVQSAQLSVDDAQQTYDNYFIRAPFAGIVGKLDVSVGDSISSGGIAATLISKDQLATVSLNEVDVAKVKVGDKVTLTFDAVNGLTLTGTVASVDLVGTVTQGVVTYNANITFDTTDPRVLTGMSVNANIITAADTDVLTVPSTAVKSDAQGSYVLVFTPALTNTGGTTGVVSAIPPQAVAVTVGLSDNTDTEIVSGLTEGEQVVTRTVAPSTTVAAATTPSLLGGAAGRGGAVGGGAARAGAGGGVRIGG